MIDERFSAYLDGEASPEETEAVLAALGRDPQLRAAWGRQHWLRSALRDADASADYDPAFAERVRHVLDADEAQTARRRRVVPFRARSRWRTVAGLAAAASVTGAVLLVSEPLGNGDAGINDAAPAAVTAAAETAGTVADARSRPVDHWSVSDPTVEDRLNGYLLEHNGLARGYGMSGATPSFLRVATYGQDTSQ